MSEVLKQIDCMIAGLMADRVQQVLIGELKVLRAAVNKELLHSKLDIMNVPKNTEPTLRAVPMSLFPVADSLQSVVDLGNSMLPIEDKNVVLNLLMTYHNTLLQELK